MEKEHQTEFLDLPNELLEKVLQHLTKIQDVRSIRLTCSRLRDLVEDSVGIGALLEFDKQDPEKLEFYSSIGIHTALIRNPNSAQFSLWRPSLLKSVTLEGTTCARFLLELLQECKNLKNCLIYSMIGEKLELEGLPMITLPLLFNIDLRMITQIGRSTMNRRRGHDGDVQVVFQAGGNGENGQEDEADVIRPTTVTTLNSLALLSSLDCPHLTNFCTEMWICEQSQVKKIISTLLTFLNKRNNVDKLYVSVRWLNGLVRPMFVVEDDKEELKNGMTRLGQKIQLSSFLISFNTTNDPWAHFLGEQKRLEKLGIYDDLGLNGWGPMQSALRNNTANLKTAYMMSSFDPEDRLDFSCFLDCANLKELLLINLNPRIYHGLPPRRHRGAHHQDNLENFDLVSHCPNLEFVAMSNITIGKEKLAQLVGLKKLSHLALLNTSGHEYGFGRAIPHGVDLEVLFQFLSKRSLQSLLIDGVIAEKAEDLQTIEQIVKELSSPQDFEDSVLNIQNKEELTTRIDDSGIRRTKRPKWSRASSGFVFDIDFYSE